MKSLSGSVAVSLRVLTSLRLRGGKKIIQEDHGGDHRHRSRSGRLSLLHSAKFRNNFSATSRKKYDDYVLYSSSNFAAPRNFLGEREITQNSWRWVSRRVADGSDDPFVLPFSNCDLLQKVSRVFLGTKVADATGRHRCTMRTPQRRPPFIILEMWSVRWARNLSRGELMWIADLLHLLRVVCLSVCMFAQKRAILRPTCACA